MKLRKIIGWILVFLPSVIMTFGLWYLPTGISLLLMRILMGIGSMSICFAGACLVSNKLPIRIIVEKDEEGEKERSGK